MAKNKSILTDDSLDFLERYLNNASPTGYEQPGQKLWMDYLRPYVDEFITDAYGSAVGVINPDADYKVVIEGHADEISWYVNHITDNGLIYVLRNGGSDHQIATSKRVNIHTKGGIVPGVFGWPAIHLRDPMKEQAPKKDNIFVDVGASSKEEVEEMDPEESVEAEVPPIQGSDLKNRLGNSRVLVGIIGLSGLAFLADFFWHQGLGSLDLNLVNFTLLMLGLLLHGTPAGYAKAVGGGAQAASSVILQFPFYAGIMGMMSYSGLAAVIAQGFVAISTTLSYPFWSLCSAGMINLMVPSGGGQWAVQGPIVVEATRVLGVDVGRSIMAVAFGDQLTNMIQPFWALPLLGITRLRAGDVLGYTAVVMMVVFVVMVLGISFLP